MTLRHFQEHAHIGILFSGVWYTHFHQSWLLYLTTTVHKIHTSPGPHEMKPYIIYRPAEINHLGCTFRAGPVVFVGSGSHLTTIIFLGFSIYTHEIFALLLYLLFQYNPSTG
jgi:hypothetical protein